MPFNELKDAVIRAIVHLNFNEPEEARSVLLIALARANFDYVREIENGHTAAA